LAVDYPFVERRKTIWGLQNVVIVWRFAGVKCSSLVVIFKPAQKGCGSTLEIGYGPITNLMVPLPCSWLMQQPEFTSPE
jgi:hypothetical protein